jgi:hypothetical protein
MLLQRQPVTVPEAVERLAGMQAQEPRPPFVGLWSRLKGFRREDLTAALQRRELVRGPLMRSTLHLAGATDFAAFRPALGPVMNDALRGIGSRTKGLELSDVLPAAAEILEAEPRDFNELRALLSERFPEVDERALGYAVRTQLALVMVPSEDPWAFPKSAKFALAEDWLGKLLPADATPDALVRAYLGAFGPASPADFTEWSGLRGARAAFEALGSELIVLADEDDRELFDLPKAPRPGPDVPAPPRFLPEFDNLVLAHADRTRVLADEHRGAVVTKNLRVRATFLLDGLVTGTWTVERRRGGAKLRLAPFETLPVGAAGPLVEEGEALLRFSEGGKVAVTVELGD